MLDSVELSCRYMFYILKVEQFEKIPANILLHRHKKKAMDYNTCTIALP